MSAVVMLAVSGTTLWLGGGVWTVFVLLLGFGVVREWILLAIGFTAPGMARSGWIAAGAIYCGLAVTTLIILRDGPGGLFLVLAILLAVICTDIGAYFAGRTFGGPKIAPKISPSKTWAGLFGGMVGAMLVVLSAIFVIGDGSVAPAYVLVFALTGIPVAIIAQSGDFFESWMKRRAGVKDSGSLIPGHGGLFDRVDGLLAVCFVIGLLMLAMRVLG